MASAALAGLALAAPARAQDTSSQSQPPVTPGQQTPLAGQPAPPADQAAPLPTQQVSPPAAQDGPPQANGIGDVIVTARRSEERLQSVPVAVSVVSPAAVDSRGTFRPYDLASLATGVAVGATVGDPANVVYSIRGQSQTYGTLFPSVITYFDEIPVASLPTGNFYDLDNVQVLRGPQGVLFGRVTDGGAVLVNTKHPTDRFEGYIEGKVGDYNLHSAEGALNIPIISDKLMVRGAFEVDRRDGYTQNLYNNVDLDNIASDAFRVSVTFKPSSSFENDTIFSYQNTHQHGDSAILTGVNTAPLINSTARLFALFTGAYGLDANGRVLPYAAGLTPLTPQNYANALLAEVARQNALGPRQTYQVDPLYYHQREKFLVNTTTVDLGGGVQFKNIFGYTTRYQDSARTLSGDNSMVVQFCASACSTANMGVDEFPKLPNITQRQLSDEARFSGKLFDDTLSWSLGAYFDDQHPDGANEPQAVNVGILGRIGLVLAHTTSRAGFGNVEYDASKFLQGLKFTGGFRYTADTADASAVTYIVPIYPAAAEPALANFLANVLHYPTAVANAVATATAYPNIQYGQCQSITGPTLFPATCRTYDLNSNAKTFSVGTSYQPDTSKLIYFKVSRGYRPGGVNGTAPPSAVPLYTPETDTSYEVGVKADWHLGSVPLRTNIAAYHDRFTNIQKTVTFNDASGPVSLVENIAAANINGVEFEGTIKPTPNLTLGLNYAFTDAHYDHINTSGPTDPCNPALFTIVGFCTDNKFQTTPRHQLSGIVNYNIPVDSRIGRVSVGGVVHYQTSETLSETSVLDPYATEPAYATVDLNASWNNIFGRPIDLAFFMTNATDKLYRIYSGDVSGNAFIGTRGDFYAPPRMFGFTLKYRFGGS